MPTYKCDFLENNSKYINKKDQCPSYTDRILIKQNDISSEVKFNQYSSRHEVFGSDHRPVFLDWSIKIKFDNWLDPIKLMNTEDPNQAFGKITFQ